MEAGRAFGELSSLPLAEAALRFAPEGDGHAVLVCPGFLTSDRSTGLLRRFIRSKGYAVHGWELGRNMGPGTAGENGERLAERVISLYRASRRKVSLVGWSLGGVLAREIAKRLPDQVRQVITLGSPLSVGPERDDGLVDLQPGRGYALFGRRTAKPAGHDPDASRACRLDGRLLQDRRDRALARRNRAEGPEH